MSVMVFIDDLATPSWRCVQFLSASAEWPSASALAEQGLELADLDAGSLASEGELLAELSKVFRFPDYFGGNWDALDECLRDLEWLPAQGYVLRVHNAEALWARLPAAAGKLVESWLFCAEEWARTGIPFHLAFLWGSRPTD
jgi:RNAse (barnase) inhibitor barstar